MLKSKIEVLSPSEMDRVHEASLAILSKKDQLIKVKGFQQKNLN